MAGAPPAFLLNPGFTQFVGGADRGTCLNGDRKVGIYHTIRIPYHTIHIPYHTIPYHTIPYHTIPYHTIPWACYRRHHAIPYHAMIHAL